VPGESLIPSAIKMNSTRGEGWGARRVGTDLGGESGAGGAGLRQWGGGEAPRLSALAPAEPVDPLLNNISGTGVWFCNVSAAMRGYRTRTERVVVNAALQAMFAAAERAEADMALVALCCLPTGGGKWYARMLVQ
jgi:hypothetical protein